MSARHLARPDSPGGADLRRSAGESGVNRQSWIGRCTDRLAALDPGAVPDAGVEHWRRLATEMWKEVALFDPVIAAEMEFEANQLDD